MPVELFELGQEVDLNAAPTALDTFIDAERATGAHYPKTAGNDFLKSRRCGWERRLFRDRVLDGDVGRHVVGNVGGFLGFNGIVQALLLRMSAVAS